MSCLVKSGAKVIVGDRMNMAPMIGAGENSTTNTEYAKKTRIVTQETTIGTTCSVHGK